MATDDFPTVDRLVSMSSANSDASCAMNTHCVLGSAWHDLLPALCVQMDVGILPFGKPFKAYFALDETWTFVNHGAFGGALNLALDLSHGENCEVAQ
jgi:hypothetical protein